MVNDLRHTPTEIGENSDDRNAPESRPVLDGGPDICSRGRNPAGSLSRSDGASEKTRGRADSPKLDRLRALEQLDAVIEEQYRLLDVDQVLRGRESQVLLAVWATVRTMMRTFLVHLH